MAGLSVLIHIAGGVALLLWGLRMIRTGVMRPYGGSLRQFLRSAAKNRLEAAATGAAVTVMLQSSTATALLTAAFVDRGFMEVGGGLAVLLGSNVGTALSALILSIDLGWLSPVAICVGLIAFSSARSSRWRDLGRAAMGLGLVLLALQLLIAASDPVSHAPLTIAVLAVLGEQPVLALLIGAGFAWLSHSSLAVVLLVVSLAGSGLVGLAAACALVLGANVGGGLAAGLLSARCSPLARRAVIGNLLCRLAGAVALVPALDFILPALADIDVSAARQVVDFHLAFNLALAALCLPFTGLAGRLLTRANPRGPVQPDDSRPRHLDEALLGEPSRALAAAARETLRVGDVIEGMLRDTLEVFRADDARLAADIRRRDDAVDRLHEAVKLYLSRVGRTPLSPTEERRCRTIIAFSTDLEHVGDIIDRNLMELAAKKIRRHLRFSKEGFEEITALHTQVMSTLVLALGAFVAHDDGLAQALLAEKKRFRERERNAADRHYARLRSGRAESIETSSLHLDVLRDLKRIHSHLTSVAHGILQESGASFSDGVRPAPS